MKNIKVSIIEDSEIHREWLKIELSDNRGLEIVSFDCLGREGIDSARMHEADLVLLDFQLKDMTGLEVSKRLKMYCENIKIFLITAHTESSVIDRIINDKNIDALAIKGTHYFEYNFINAIHHVAEGGTYLDPSLLKKLRVSKKFNSLSSLTKREFEIFIQTSIGKPDIKIAEDLCVELSHVKNIKSKISKKIKNDDINNLISKLIENSSFSL